MIPCAWQIGKSERDDRAILSNQFGHIGDRANRHHLQKARHLDFAAALSKQRVNQLEGDANARQILIGIFTAFLIRIQHCQRGRCAFFLVRQMMVGDDDVEAIRARPMKRLMRGDAAVDTDYQFVSLTRGLFERILSNAITLCEAMRNVITRRGA